MRTALLVAMTALGMACASEKHQEREAPAAAPATAAVDAGAPLREAAMPPPTPGNAGGVHGLGGGLPLLPPAQPGASATQLTGCLAEAAPSDTSGDRFPVPAATRTAPAPAVQVSALGNGIVVSHHLEHACCLKAAVETTLVGSEVRVQETLTGDPCRCRCSSVVKTAVGLPVGSYQVTVNLLKGDQASVVHQQAVSVGTPGK